MSSPFLIDHPSPPLPSTSIKAYSPQSRTSTEAFPDFQSSPVTRSSASIHQRIHPNNHLGVPGAESQRPVRPFRSASQRLPPTALLPSSRNASHNDLTTPTADREEPPQQRLPRALPAPSLSGPSVRPTPSMAQNLIRKSTTNVVRPNQANAEELKSESLWADMQRTLADVELSAMKSSHLFNAPHSQALEKLRETQLALAQAWARSEADETVGQESEDESLISEPEVGTQASQLADNPASSKNAKGKPTSKDTGPKPVDNRARQGSNGSNIGRDLEEETERDIKLARKRREANDHYFSQVNRGVLNVVTRLDEVASAMRTVERESRAVWNEMTGAGEGSTTASASELDNDTDGDGTRGGSSLARKVTQATTTTTTETGTGSGTEMSDSPVTPRKSTRQNTTNEKTKDTRTTATKEKGR